MSVGRAIFEVPGYGHVQFEGDLYNGECKLDDVSWQGYGQDDNADRIIEAFLQDNAVLILNTIIENYEPPEPKLY